MIHTSNKFSVLGLPMPFASKLRLPNTFYWKRPSFPTQKQIAEKADELGIKKDGFSIHSVTRVPANFRNFDEPGIMIVTDET